MTTSYLLHLAYRDVIDGETRTYTTREAIENAAARLVRDEDEDLIDCALVVERDLASNRVLSMTPFDVLKAARQIVAEEKAEEAAYNRQAPSYAGSCGGRV